MKKKLIIISILLILAIVAVFSLLLSKSKKALLSINAIPEAEISINGKVFGSTPNEFELSPGKYEVSLSVYQGNNQRVSYVTEVALEPQVKTIIQRNLHQNTVQQSGSILSLRHTSGNNSSVSVVATPATSHVLIDKTRYQAPITVPSVESGNHILRVSAPGFETYETVFQAVPGFDLIAFVELGQSNINQKPEAVVNTQKLVEITSTPVGFLRVRREPNSASVEVAQVRPGERYPVSDESNSQWWKISVNGVEGWISRQYATLL